MIKDLSTKYGKFINGNAYDFVEPSYTLICDYCGIENENTKEYIIPSRESIDVKDKNNILIFREYKTVDVKKDICPEYQNKIATL